MSQIDEKLLELTTLAEQQKAEIERLKGEAEQLQIDFANKLATAKVEFETKELEYKKQIKELTVTLELRVSNEREKNKSKGKTVNQLWEEVTGETK